MARALACRCGRLDFSFAGRYGSPSMDESALLDKLRKVEALSAGATTEPGCPALIHVASATLCAVSSRPGVARFARFAVASR